MAKIKVYPLSAQALRAYSGKTQTGWKLGHPIDGDLRETRQSLGTRYLHSPRSPGWRRHHGRVVGVALESDGRSSEERRSAWNGTGGGFHHAAAEEAEARCQRRLSAALSVKRSANFQLLVSRGSNRS